MRVTLAVVIGLIAGSMANMGLITLSPMVIPPPAGTDPADVASLQASIHLFETRHFIFPFLAHALGTLAGACVAALIAVNHKGRAAFAVGALFLIGGIANAFMIPAPAWFIAVDLVGAYLPMTWLGQRLTRRG